MKLEVWEEELDLGRVAGQRYGPMDKITMLNI
jgi:hypothetical protein